MLAYCIFSLFRVYAIHEVAKTLGREKCKALLFFHALTGSDTTSFFLEEEEGLGSMECYARNNTYLCTVRF